MDPVEFTHARTVVPEDIDQQGHVSNIAYVRFIQDVAQAHAMAVGQGPDTLGRMGAMFVVRKHEIEYLRPARLGDVLSITTHVASWRGAKSERLTRIVRVADGALLVRASTVWVLVGVDSGRPRRIPRALREAFSRSPP